ncbi:MAG: hypothetical protein Kow00129_09140 [Thermoleophilia bacterium]
MTNYFVEGAGPEACRQRGIRRGFFRSLPRPGARRPARIIRACGAPLFFCVPEALLIRHLLLFSTHTSYSRMIPRGSRGKL